MNILSLEMWWFTAEIHRIDHYTVKINHMCLKHSMSREAANRFLTGRVTGGLTLIKLSQSMMKTT